MPKSLGNLSVWLLKKWPALQRRVNNALTSKFADDGPLPGLHTTKDRNRSSLWELLHKENFSLIVPMPDPKELEGLPDFEDLKGLFERSGPFTESRVSLLLPFFAQHLTDAVFQSDGLYGTNASHEIILNQIYGNTPQDEHALRLGEHGKLKSQLRHKGERAAEYPDALFEQTPDGWQVKERYRALSYLEDQSKIEKLEAAYKGYEGEVCATGLFQGNMTLGNFAITTLLLREHNRLCDGILEERQRQGLSIEDELIFRIAQQNNVTAYMKVVIEDYINAFAGQKIFILDRKSFFHEAKRWCRETPLPFHFNILYRIHSMIPDTLKGYEDQKFSAMRANNQLVMTTGIGEIFQIASSQGAGKVGLKNTHRDLWGAEKAALVKSRPVLGSFNAHRVALGLDPVGFEAFDPVCRSDLERLYKGDPDRVEYAVGIYAEMPERGVAEKLGIKDDPIIGTTLMNAIAKHAFRHILSNRFMTQEFLNKEVLGDFGWENLNATSTVADLVKRNVSGEMDMASAQALQIGFVNPNHAEQS